MSAARARRLRAHELLRLVADKIERGEDCRGYIARLRRTADKIERYMREVDKMNAEIIKFIDQTIKDAEPFVQERLETQAPLDEFLWKRGKDCSSG